MMRFAFSSFSVIVGELKVILCSLLRVMHQWMFCSIEAKREALEKSQRPRALYTWLSIRIPRSTWNKTVCRFKNPP